jgi:hypothetical protein
VRASAAGHYAPGTQAVTLDARRTAPDPAPLVTLIHENAHRDMTERSVGGLLERMLARALEAGPGPSHAAVDAALGAFMEASFLVHEGVATYMGMYAHADASREEPGGTPIDRLVDELPIDYRAALDTIGELLPDVRAPSAWGSHVIPAVALAIGKEALGLPGIDDFLRAGQPPSWDRLAAWLAAQRPDDRMLEMLAVLQRQGGLARLLDRCRDLPVSQGLAAVLRDELRAITAGELAPSPDPSVIGGDILAYLQALPEPDLRQTFGRIAFQPIVDKRPTTRFQIEGLAALWQPRPGERRDGSRAIAWLRRVQKTTARSPHVVMAIAWVAMPDESSGSTVRLGPMVVPIDKRGRPVSSIDAARVREECGGAIALHGDDQGLLLEELARNPEMARLVVWHHHPLAATVALEVDFEAVYPGPNVFYLEDTDSFEAVLAELARRGRVRVQKTDIMQGSAGHYFIRPDRPSAWSIIGPEIALMTSLDHVRQTAGNSIVFLGEREGSDNPAIYLTARYTYLVAWNGDERAPGIYEGDPR